MEKILVVVALPGIKAKIVEIPNTWEGLNKIIGGYLEAFPWDPEELGWHGYCHEEGKLEGLDANLNLGHDVVVGPIVVSKGDAEGEDIGLSPEEAQLACVLIDIERRV